MNKWKRKMGAESVMLAIVLHRPQKPASTPVSLPRVIARSGRFWRLPRPLRLLLLADKSPKRCKQPESKGERVGESEERSGAESQACAFECKATANYLDHSDLVEAELAAECIDKIFIDDVSSYKYIRVLLRVGCLGSFV